MNDDIKAAAKRYADFDRSDPFAYSRAISHYYNGICGQQIYNAEAIVKGDEDENTHTRYRNVVRP